MKLGENHHRGGIVLRTSKHAAGGVDWSDLPHAEARGNSCSELSPFHVRLLTCVNNAGGHFERLYGRLGDKFFEMTIWTTRVGRLRDSNWTFERQASRRLGDKNETLRLEQPQSEGL